MTDTFFIRHSSALDVDTATLEALWRENRIAIHYPYDLSDAFENGDSQSLNPDDYAGTARAALRRLHKLAKNGGYVFATYRGNAGGKVGFVEPGSVVELFRGAWRGKNHLHDREAVLKSLKLTQVRNLAAEIAVSLTAVQPRQGTFCKWWKVGKRIEAMVQGDPAIGLESLTPDLQEVMCMEYLRTEKSKNRGLPVLRYTLMPVGRTMKDIDILGVSESGMVISAQVTFKYLNDSSLKLKKLDAYKTQGNDTIFFCNCEDKQTINGHIIFPLQQVFDDFCVDDPVGKEWFRKAVGG